MSSRYTCRDKRATAHLAQRGRGRPGAAHWRHWHAWPPLPDSARGHPPAYAALSWETCATATGLVGSPRSYRPRPVTAGRPDMMRRRCAGRRAVRDGRLPTSSPVRAARGSAHHSAVAACPLRRSPRHVQPPARADWQTYPIRRLCTAARGTPTGDVCLTPTSLVRWAARPRASGSVVRRSRCPCAGCADLMQDEEEEQTWSPVTRTTARGCR